MTFPRGYNPKKENSQDKNSQDKNNFSNNDTNKINKNENNSIDKPITTIGEAVKEAIETGEEVIVAGPQTAGELTGITENPQVDSIQNSSNEKINDQQTNFNESLSDNSKLEINLSKSTNGTASMAKEEKVILNPIESTSNNDEATIKTITTIPTEGVNVEAETDITVPLKDKEENLKAESDVQVNSMTTPTANSESVLESRDLDKFSSLNKESSQLETQINPEQHSDNTLSNISREQERKEFQPSSSSEVPLRDGDTPNPYIMYTTFWQNFMSNWFNTYNEYLKNFMRMNSFWFRKP